MLRFAVEPDDDGAFCTRNIVFREALTTAPAASPLADAGEADDANPEDYDDEAMPALAPHHDVRRPRRPRRAADVSAPPGTDAECCACSARFHMRLRNAPIADVCSGECMECDL